MTQNSEKLHCWVRASGKGLSNTPSHFFPSHKFLFCFLNQMCCFCQIPEIRSVCHLWVWPLSLVNAFGHLCYCQKLHFQFTPKSMPWCSPWIRHWGFLEFSPHSVMSKGHLDFVPFPCLYPAPRYFYSGWTHSHSNNYDGGNYCIFACLSYLTMQKFNYNLDTDSQVNSTAELSQILVWLMVLF